MSDTILIVDDEKDLVDMLEFNLRREGFQTRSALTGRGALQQSLMEPTPSLILLDLMLPDVPGTEVCRKLREQTETQKVPIIMLTARGDEFDRVLGFEVGADDYVTKPFSVRELLLRVRAILRRSQDDKKHDEELLERGVLKVDMRGHRVWVSDNDIQLTALEFRLLCTLLSRAGRVQTRDTLLSDVWGMNMGVTTRTVDTHMTRLRKKLGSASDYIETIRGVGYRFKESLAPISDQS